MAPQVLEHPGTRPTDKENHCGRTQDTPQVIRSTRHLALTMIRTKRGGPASIA
jgi:hypothetical protein